MSYTAPTWSVGQAVTKTKLDQMSTQYSQVFTDIPDSVTNLGKSANLFVGDLTTAALVAAQVKLHVFSTADGLPATSGETQTAVQRWHVDASVNVLDAGISSGGVAWMQVSNRTDLSVLGRLSLQPRAAATTNSPARVTVGSDTDIAFFGVVRGTVTNDATPAVAASVTWNSGGTTHRGVDWIFTETATAATSTYFRIMGGAAGTTEEFAVETGGNVRAAGKFAMAGTTFTATSLTEVILGADPSRSEFLQVTGGDLWMGSAAAGSTRLLTTANTSTASSANGASHILYASGENNTGDAWTTWQSKQGGAYETSWSAGVDTSASQAWVLSQSGSLGTNNALSIAKSTLAATFSGTVTANVTNAFNSSLATDGMHTVVVATNTSTGTAARVNGISLVNDTGTVGVLSAQGSNYSTSGSTIADAVRLVGAGAGGLTLVASGAAGDVTIWSRNAPAATWGASQAVTFHGGVVGTGATGGNKGAGTANFTAVYDDNVLLTDWVFDLYYEGATRHPMPAGGRLFALTETRVATRDLRRLPWMPTRESFEAERNLGSMVTKLWFGQEQQQIYIQELEARLSRIEQRAGASLWARLVGGLA